MMREHIDKIHNADCLEFLGGLPGNSIDLMLRQKGKERREILQQLR